MRRLSSSKVSSFYAAVWIRSLTSFIAEVQIEDVDIDDGLVYDEVPEDVSGESDDSECQLRETIAAIKLRSDSGSAALLHR